VAHSKINYRLSDFMGYLSLLEEHELSVKKADRGSYGDVVKLMTAHKAKGLEFETVYIIKVNDGHWGNRRTRDLFKLPVNFSSLIEEKNQEDRKLFFVAITRAKKECIISSFALSKDGRNILPSQFISEIDANLLEEQKSSKVLPRLLRTLSFGRGESTPKLEIEYLKELFNEQGLSISAINNYLDCPWKYIFQNLIRIPSNPNKFQHYGNAVHDSISETINLIGRDKKTSKNIFINIFKRNILSKPLSDSDYKELLKKGVVAMSGFYEKNIDHWKKSKLITELGVAGVFIDDGADKVLLKGRLDLVEYMPDGSVKVTDFKTGKPKSRNDIIGNTKNSDGNYYRQLTFYKLLLDNFDNQKYDMRLGEIYFTEPTPRGQYKSEVFEINKDEVEDLKSKVLDIATKIRNFNYWNKKCKDRKCNFCKMSELLKQNTNYKSWSKEDIISLNSK
jgi:DNA helicase II / ATP-dependent DNA helicase PcrA